MSRLKRGNWSTHELQRLRVLYPRSAEKNIARLLHRSVSSVHLKAQEMFSGPRIRRAWTAEDDLRLREGYGVLDFPALCLVLRRQGPDVLARIERLRTNLLTGRPWTRTEVGFLKRLYGSRSDADLVVSLSRPIGEILAQSRALCLSKNKNFATRSEKTRRVMPRWRGFEVELLKRRYPHTSNLELARRFNRSVVSVANKASQLGLKKDSVVLSETGRRNVSGRYR